MLTVLFAFLAYLLCAGLASLMGARLAPTAPNSALKTSTYSSGESAPPEAAAPGYQRFFVIALFFAMLHLGMLVLGTSNLAPAAALYLVGIAFILVTLILG